MSPSMRRIVPNQRDEGFTLVELVVAMLIIGIVLVSVATVQVGTLQTNADNAARNTASALANGAMEQFRSLPWNVLRKGMASNYLTASGGDPLVSGGVLTVDGGHSYPLVVAPSGASDQDITALWLPLFDNTGSHIQEIDDPEGNGNTYLVKGYVTENDAGVDGAVGLAVVVEWQRPGSTVTHRTSMFSSAYAPVGGCGNLDTAPFLTSCQPQYHSIATTASMTVLVSASEYNTATGEVGAAAPVVPGEEAGGITSAGSRARAEADSAQSTVVMATVEHAVASVSPLSGTGTATIAGGSKSVSQASNNTADPDAPPAHGVPTSGIIIDAWAGVWRGGDSVTVDGDYNRGSAVTASTSFACQIGGGNSVPAQQPCAAARLDGTSWSDSLEASLDIDDEWIELITSNHSAAGTSYAWAGRYQLGRPTGPGCTALSGAGCIAAGATSFVPTVYVGEFGSWVDSLGDPLPDQHLVRITDYDDSVLVRRGASQSATSGDIARDADIEFWDGTAYQPISVDASTEGVWDTGVVFYDGANITLTAYATIAISAASGESTGADCEVDRCRVQADAGLISVTLKIIVEPDSGTPYLLEAVALINGSNGDAEYTEPADV